MRYGGLHAAGLAVLSVVVSTVPAGVVSAQTCETGSIETCEAVGDWHIRTRGDYRTASEFFRRGCAGNIASSCGRLAAVGRLRPELGMEHGEINQLLVRSCVTGYRPSCEIFAGDFVHDRTAARAQPQARSALDHACNQGIADGCLALAYAQEQGVGERANATTAAATYQRACRLRSGPACAALARLLHARPRAADRTRAEEAAEYGCRLQDAEACGMIGVWRTEAGDHAAAFPHLVAGCGEGRAAACEALGNSRLNGLTGSVDLRGAAEAFRLACLANSSTSCGQLALLLMRSRPTDESIPPNLQRGCEGGLLRACESLGLVLLTRGDVRGALPHLQRSCEGGDADACLHLATVYETGRLGTPEPVAGARYRLAACRAGRTETCEAAALALLPHDRRAAQGILTDACEAGSAASCTALAGSLRGRQSEVFFARACELGNLDSCGVLGIASAPRDPGRARPLLERACAPSRPDVCVALATLLLGDRSTRDETLPDALTAAEHACSAGNGRGCELRGEIQRRLAPPSAPLVVGPPAQPEVLTAATAVATTPTTPSTPTTPRQDAEPPRPAVVAPPPVELTPTQACQRRGDMSACVVAGHAALEANDMRGARRFLSRACDANDAVACASLGGALVALGASGQREGGAFLARACEAGSAVSCSMAAAALVGAQGARAALVRQHVLERGAALGDGASQHQLALLLSAQPAAGEDQLHRIAGLFANACGPENEAACRAGFEFTQQHPASRVVTAEGLRLEQWGCEHQDASACARHGRALMGSDGIERDEVRALDLLERACLGGERTVCSIAVELMRRQGTEDRARLMPLLAQGCADGDLVACASAGTLEVSAPAPNRERAEGWLGQACVGGLGPACAVLGDLLVSQPARENAAIQNYRMACTSETTEGCRGLATLCLRGRLNACEGLAGACAAGVASACPTQPVTE